VLNGRCSLLLCFVVLRYRLPFYPPPRLYCADVGWPAGCCAFFPFIARSVRTRRDHQRSQLNGAATALTPAFPSVWIVGTTTFTPTPNPTETIGSYCLPLSRSRVLASRIVSRRSWSADLVMARDERFGTLRFVFGSPVPGFGHPVCVRRPHPAHTSGFFFLHIGILLILFFYTVLPVGSLDNGSVPRALVHVRLLHFRRFVVGFCACAMLRTPLLRGAAPVLLVGWLGCWLQEPPCPPLHTPPHPTPTPTHPTCPTTFI
jgi:hypothetical protein